MEILPLLLVIVGVGVDGIPLPTYLRRASARVNVKPEKTTIVAVALALSGLFTYSEVVKKDNEISIKEHRYQEIVKSVKGLSDK